MVEVGSIQIGGSIQTAEIERGLLRVEKGFNKIETKGKSVNADFERMNQQSKKLARTLGTMALAGAGALIAIAKGAPATAGAMAKIKVGAMKLQFAIGEALQDEFEAFSGHLNNIASWVRDNPDLFSGIVKSIVILGGAAAAIAVGGKIFGAFAAFLGLLKGVGAALGGAAGAGAGAGAAGIGASLGGFAGTLGSGVAIGVGPLINTYQREITGQPGFLDRLIKSAQDYNFGQMSRQDHERQMQYNI